MGALRPRTGRSIVAGAWRALFGLLALHPFDDELAEGPPEVHAVALSGEGDRYRLRIRKRRPTLHQKRAQRPQPLLGSRRAYEGSRVLCLVWFGMNLSVASPDRGQSSTSGLKGPRSPHFGQVGVGCPDAGASRRARRRQLPGLRSFDTSVRTVCGTMHQDGLRRSLPGDVSAASRRC